MTESKIPIKSQLGWTSQVLAQGFTQYVNRDTKLAVIALTGYSVSSAQAGNAGSTDLRPLKDVLVSVSAEGVGQRIFRIRENGVLDLLNGDLGSYSAGKIYGMAVFPIN